MLAVIFDRVTDGCNTNSEIYEEVYQFLFRIEMNHPKGLQAMHRNGQMVTDPLLLLELQEMRCGQIARLAVDLFAAGGYSGRLVQGDGHVWAEIWYDNKWRFLMRITTRNLLFGIIRK